MIRGVILDRDGTLIKHVPYLSRPCDVQLLPGVREGLQRLRDAHCWLFLHSNQSGVGQGRFTLKEVDACNAAMIDLLDMGPAPFERICIAPETIEQESGYRKPSPRFGEDLITDFGFARHELCYIGDNLPDMLAAKNLGSLGVGVTTGLENLRSLLRENGLFYETPVFDSFLDAAMHVVAQCDLRNG